MTGIISGYLIHKATIDCSGLIQLFLRNSGHALEVFAAFSGIAIFLISKIKYKIK